MAREGAAARPAPLGVRGQVLLALLLAGVWAFWQLGLSWGDLVPSEGGRAIAGEFLVRAFSPALSSEAEFVPPDAPPLLLQAWRAVGATLVFAAAAMSLSIVFGLALGFFASTAWWSCTFPAGSWIARTLYVVARTVVALMRSVHELLWALLFLIAFGLSDLVAVFALTIPYAGTLAKIYSELIDEAPRDSARALHAAGASGVAVFCIGLVPRALPDMAAYTFYRFECAIRASAVLGFFGYETVGLYIKQSFSSANYGEVWTYLYALLVVVLVFDVWSGRLRKRLLA